MCRAYGTGCALDKTRPRALHKGGLLFSGGEPCCVCARGSLAGRTMGRVCWTLSYSFLPLGSWFRFHSFALLLAETVAGKRSRMPRASVPSMEFVGTVQISQGLTALAISQAPHWATKPCRNCRTSVLSWPLSLEPMGIIAALRSRLTP